MALKKKPCSFCRKWFLPDARVGKRQRACAAPGCRAARKKRSQARWLAAQPGYFAARRIEERAINTPSSTDHVAVTPAHARPPPPRMPRPLDGLPWDLAQDEFGPQGADFVALFGRVMRKATQDEIRAEVRRITA